MAIDCIENTWELKTIPHFFLSNRATTTDSNKKSVK